MFSDKISNRLFKSGIFFYNVSLTKTIWDIIDAYFLYKHIHVSKIRMIVEISDLSNLSNNVFKKGKKTDWHNDKQPHAINTLYSVLTI